MSGTLFFILTGALAVCAFALIVIKDALDARPRKMTEDAKAKVEEFYNELPLTANPCRICRNRAEVCGGTFKEACTGCCWFYGSCFELREEKE